jgi:hypothetical protein
MLVYQSKVNYKGLVIDQLIYIIDKSNDEVIELKNLYSGTIFKFWESEEKFLEEIIIELQDRGYAIDGASVIKKNDS